MSAYSLAHVLDVPGWPTVWGLEPEASLVSAPTKGEVDELTAQVSSITARLKRLQLRSALAA